jgi:hypothetical protein
LEYQQRNSSGCLSAANDQPQTVKDAKINRSAFENGRFDRTTKLGFSLRCAQSPAREDRPGLGERGAGLQRVQRLRGAGPGDALAAVRAEALDAAKAVKTITVSASKSPQAAKQYASGLDRLA